MDEDSWPRLTWNYKGRRRGV